MARGDGVNDFIRNLMRKLFTDNYMSTKTLTKMEKAHQTAIIGQFIFLFLNFIA